MSDTDGSDDGDVRDMTPLEAARLLRDDDNPAIAHIAQAYLDRHGDENEAGEP